MSLNVYDLILLVIHVARQCNWCACNTKMSQGESFIQRVPLAAESDQEEDITWDYSDSPLEREYKTFNIFEHVSRQVSTGPSSPTSSPSRSFGAENVIDFISGNDFRSDISSVPHPFALDGRESSGQDDIRVEGLQLGGYQPGSGECGDPFDPGNRQADRELDIQSQDLQPLRSRHLGKGNTRSGEQSKPGVLWFITAPNLFRPRMPHDIRDACKVNAYESFLPQCDELIVAAESHEIHMYCKFKNPISFEQLNEVCEYVFFKHCNLEKPRAPDRIIKYVTKHDYPVLSCNVPHSKFNESYKVMEACAEMVKEGGFNPTHPFIRTHIKYINLARGIYARMHQEHTRQLRACMGFQSFKFCAWMIEVLKFFSVRPTIRSKALYIWGAPESYKTSFINFVCEKLKLSVCLCESSGNWSFQSYKGEKVIFMNDFDTRTVSRGLLLNLLENSPCQLPVKMGMGAFRGVPTYNIITSNTSPDDLEWDQAMRSRIKEVWTDFAMVKVEVEVQSKWEQFLERGYLVSDEIVDHEEEIILISDSEDEENVVSSDVDISSVGSTCLSSNGVSAILSGCPVMASASSCSNMSGNSSRSNVPAQSLGGKDVLRHMVSMVTFTPPDPGMLSSEEEEEPDWLFRYRPVKKRPRNPFILDEAEEVSYFLTSIV